MKREFLQSLTVEGTPLSKEVIDAIMAENGKDIEASKQAGRQWEERYNQAEAQHEKQVKQLQLQSAIDTAVAKAGGRNAKAITALLDPKTLEGQEDLIGAATTAVETLKQEHGYLFYQTTVPYARGTGKEMPERTPLSLAEALRQRTNT